MPGPMSFVLRRAQGLAVSQVRPCVLPPQVILRVPLALPAGGGFAGGLDTRHRRGDGAALDMRRGFAASTHGVERRGTLCVLPHVKGAADQAIEPALDTRGRSCAHVRDVSAYVYILACGDGRRYFGSTTDLRRRLSEHRNGWVRSTKGRLPVRLVYFEECSTLAQARQREHALKNGRTRSKTIENLICTFPADLLAPFA